MAAGQPTDSDFLHSLVFAIWDNVIGPKILKIWLPTALIEKEVKVDRDANGDEVDEVGVEISEENQSMVRTSNNENGSRASTPVVRLDDNVVAKYLAIHTLTGHLTIKPKETDFESVSDVCLSVPALCFISQTATFYCHIFSNYNASNAEGCIEDPCMCSLSIVFHFNHENIFWNLQPLVIHLLHQVAHKIKFGLSRDPCYHERPIVTAWIADISSQIHATVDLSVKFPTRSPLKVKHIFLNSLLAWDIIITAMLTTGSCCVVGRNEDAINQILDLLIFFLPDVGQIHCSRYTSNRFCGGLNLQGLLEGAQGTRSINSAAILLNDNPLTLVDLVQKGKVKFSGYLHEHYRCKQRQLRQQEYNIIENLDPDTPFTTESVFRSFGGSSRYVRWCLEQLESHNVEHWSRIISSFHRALSYQANTLIKALHNERTQKTESSMSLCSRLKKVLQITEPDLWLLAATAERMQPGFCRIFVNYRVF